MKKPILGIHSFYTADLNHGPFKSIDLLIQLASAMYWQKSFGPICLYTTDEAESQLFQYGMHRAYSMIDTVRYRESVYLPRFWALNKMQVTAAMGKSFSQVCMLDRDFYIKSQKYFDADAQLLAYHEETVNFENPRSGYPNPEGLYQVAEVENPIDDWGKTAFNTGMLYLNGAEELMDHWLFHSSIIIRNSHKWMPLPVSGDMTFIEQYLLSALCKAMKINAKTYLNAEWTYQPANHTEINEKNWKYSDPLEIFSEKLNQETFHAWGLKTMYYLGKVRTEILTRVITDLKTDFPGIELVYDKLFAEAEALLADTSDYFIDEKTSQSKDESAE